MKLKTSTYSTGNFLWKPMEQMEKFVKHYIMPNLWGELQVLSNLNQVGCNYGIR